jgi:anaerobic ribonucleoside-triphosphate reductase activating protein
MKSTGHTIVFKEHPDYVSLLISISNCPVKCEKCHTPELQQDIGEEFTEEKLTNLLLKYDGLIQNVIFFGGDQYPVEIVALLKICKKFNLKTTLWTGMLDIAPCIKMYVDYLKTGPYIESKGGLNSPTTNQRYIEVKTGKEIKLYGK